MLLSTAETLVGPLGNMDPTMLTVEIAYLFAAISFIVGLKLLSSPETARQGMFLAEIGMMLAVVGTLFHHDVITYEWIAIGLAIGTAAGAVIAIWTPMTAMPERTALSHAFGALAVALVGVAAYYSHGGVLPVVKMTAVGLEVMLGAITFSGSLVAWGKLRGTLPGAPITYPMQNLANMAILVGLVGSVLVLIVVPGAPMWIFYAMGAFSFVFGVLLVLPIGAADMPVVMALLNSYAGLAGSATGFAIDNKILIIAGALDGASGFILSILMCKAMNRSITNVLFGAFGKPPEAAEGEQVTGTTQSMTAQEAAEVIIAADRVVIVPGYGMAVSQAQLIVKEFYDALTERGIDVKFAVHPVAGRMPGHMNVLLAEAGVPYDRLYDMDQINPEFRQTDVAIVIGANDVVNPAARTNKASPIYGMPILNADEARHVFVLKRSMAAGFAGIENELFYRPNCTMVFGDAKKTVIGFVDASRNTADAEAA
jgi:NAD(P) transhydrogenase subunit beta